MGSKLNSSGNYRGRDKRFTVDDLETAWEEYKKQQDNNTCSRTGFSSKNSEFVTETVRQPLTYSIVGFCCFLGISEQCWRDTYESSDDPVYTACIDRIRAESHQSCRRLFEQGSIPLQLAPLWMSRWGYSTRQETEVKGAMPVVISGEDGLQD